MNQEKALVGALSVIVKTDGPFAALVCTLSTAEEEAAAERDHHHHIIIVSCGHQQHFCQEAGGGDHFNPFLLCTSSIQWMIIERSKTQNSTRFLHPDA